MPADMFIELTLLDGRKIAMSCVHMVNYREHTNANNAGAAVLTTAGVDYEVKETYEEINAKLQELSR